MTDAHKNVLYRDWLNLSMHLLWVYARELLTGDVSEPRWFNSGAWLVVDGWAEMTKGGKTYRATTGQWLIFNEGDRLQKFRKPVHLMSMAYVARWPDGTPFLDSGLPIVLDGAQYPQLEENTREILHMMERAVPKTWDARMSPIDRRQFLSLHATLPLWLNDLLDILEQHGIHPNTPGGMDQRVTQAVRFLNSAPLEEPLDIGELAVSTGLSQVHLDRLFRQYLGTSISGYFNRLRLEYAYRSLRVGNRLIKTIAYDLGFSHQAHFTRWFKQQTGQTPKQFASQHQR